MSDLNIQQINKEVNMTFSQAKKNDWDTIAKFIVLGSAKLMFFASIIWLIRNI